MAQVTLKNIWKKYGDLAVVKDVNLVIPDKSFYVLVGPSGCGKSTTLRMIAGLEEISQGEIYIDERLVNGVPPKNRDIAMVFQNYALYPHMTVYENMAFGLKLRRMPKKEIDDRVREAAEILGITNLLERRPKALSGGQRQRVAVGRAIVRKPKVFLFDEPLSNLDAKMRVHMRLEIAKLHKRLQTTIIYVTHDQLEAMTLATSVALMKDGTVQQVAPPLEIYNKPANKFVAGFIGNPPMNFFEVDVKKSGSNLSLSIGKNGAKGNLELANGVKQRLEPYAGKTIVMGVRPEDIYDKVYYQGSGKGRTVSSTVEVVEPMGAEKYLYLSALGNSVVVRVSPDNQAHVNQNIDLVFHLENAKFFNKETDAVIQ
ncbi:MAG: sn-glycerol-3-phosphate import ATP-binding protein UgpC [Elusimicrobia bacterium]|nr:sn-glycerol-3-phosphate import ATP-binding protein UgpC [Elusimicrobiota bacterium]